MPRPRKRYKKHYTQMPRRNYLIRAPQVRAIDEKGQNIGVIDTKEAIKLAEEKNLDLIEISKKTNPPIAKIMDYGKYVYKLEKKERETRENQSTLNVTKGIRISIRTSEHDLEIKATLVDKFLKKGYKVKVELLMRGREKGLKDLADKKIEKFLQTLKEPYAIDQEPKRHPRGMFFMLSKQ